MAVRVFALAFLLACGGTYGGKPRAPAGPAGRGIVAAALPYSVLDARTGRQVDTEMFWGNVASSRVVCVGEEHPNPHHHWFQLETVTQAATRRKTGPLALGMEMFQRPFQGVLDDYAAKRIDTAALLSRSGYEERWGYDYAFYGPTIDRARAAGAALLALNAPRELTKKLVRQGLEGLEPDDKKQVPELNLDDRQHRVWFDTTMEEMSGPHGAPHAPSAGDKPGEPAHATPEAPEPPKASDTPADSAPAMPSADRIYAAQVLWDETMADGAATWAKAHPTGLVVLLAGNGHCHDSAIVRRIQRRGVDHVISIQPVLDVEGRVARALASPVNDYLVVLELPADQKAAPEK
jgi:uncharacterized iron-regulated protein